MNITTYVGPPKRWSVWGVGGMVDNFAYYNVPGSLQASIRHWKQALL